MARLPRFGSSSVTPSRKLIALKRILSDLCGGHAFDDLSVERHYFALGHIIGDWSSEQERLEAEPIAKLLRAAAENLSEVVWFVAGTEPGLRTSTEIAIATRVREIMTLNPAVGSREAAEKLLGSFRQNADLLAHVFRIVAADLPTHPEKRGARKKDWYDQFTRHLLDIAEQAGVKPTLYKDRIRNKPKGWLLDASRELETFLPEAMRSRSDDARYKRLERSKANLGKRDDKIVPGTG